MTNPVTKTTHWSHASKNATLRQRSPVTKYHSLIDKVYSIKNLNSAYITGARRSGGPGSDGVTWPAYAADLPNNLQHLSAELRGSSFEFKPPSNREVNNRKNRAFQIWIWTVEERIVQHALKQVLSRIIEPHLSPVSYGFRKRRGPRATYDRLNEILRTFTEPHLAEFDIQSCFASIPRRHAIELLCCYIADSKVIALVEKALGEGTGSGLPTGNVMSILLAELFLKNVDEILPSNRMIRYCDSIIAISNSAAELRSDIEFAKAAVERFHLKLNQAKTKIWYSSSLRQGLPPPHDLLFN